MGMAVIIDLPKSDHEEDFEAAFDYFTIVDDKFSPYKKESEVSKINRGEVAEESFSEQMKEVLKLSEETKQQSLGFFDVWCDGKLDPSGLVKGWAIHNAADKLRSQGFSDFYVEAGGDIEVSGKNKDEKEWRIGIQNPFNRDQIIKVIKISNGGIATSGSYFLGQHIYDPHLNSSRTSDIISLTVVGPTIYEADRFATAAFAMGKDGLDFIENKSGLEGYMIDHQGYQSQTSGFERCIDA